MEHRGVMVFGEQRGGMIHPVTFELLARGRGLADKLGVPLGCALIGCGVEAFALECIRRGADKVYVVDHPSVESFLARPYANALARLVEEERPEIVVAAATTSGRTVMPLVAAKLKTGLTADCTELDVDVNERLLLQTRPAIGGNVMATIKTPVARPQMATVRPKSVRPAQADTRRTGEIVRKAYEPQVFLTPEAFLGFVKDDSQTVNVQDADVIIAGGKGLKNRLGFELIEELAGLLGAAVGATRDVVDLGWIGYPHQIGLSGKTVSPRLYLAIGLSGSVQHLAGMQTSETIVAINKDKDAQIFKVADFGIVGDLFEVVPEVIRQLSRVGGAAGRQAG